VYFGPDFEGFYKLHHLNSNIAMHKLKGGEISMHM
jgi:hypothetical protein